MNLSRRSFISGLGAALVMAPSIVRASVLPYQIIPAIGGVTVDPQSLLIYWGPFQAGDEGAPIQVYAYPSATWQFTGYPQGNVVTNPNVPIMADRTMTVLGTNDTVCWGPAFDPMVANPAGMAARDGDPMHSGDHGFMFLKPKAGGSFNLAGPDCGLLLYCSKIFAPRT